MGIFVVNEKMKGRKNGIVPGSQVCKGQYSANLLSKASNSCRS